MLELPLAETTPETVLTTPLTRPVELLDIVEFEEEKSDIVVLDRLTLEYEADVEVSTMVTSVVGDEVATEMVPDAVAEKVALTEPDKVALALPVAT